MFYSLYLSVNVGGYIQAVLDRNLAENISRVLYPNDNVSNNYPIICKANSAYNILYLRLICMHTLYCNILQSLYFIMGINWKKQSLLAQSLLHISAKLPRGSLASNRDSTFLKAEPNIVCSW